MGGLAKGLSILEAFGPEQRQMTLSDAARLTGISPAAARRCLNTMVEQGYLRHDGKYFRPTPRVVRLGRIYLDAQPLEALAQPILDSFRDSMQESVSLAVLEGDMSAFIARAESTGLVTAGGRVGARLPAHGSATGRVLLAGMSDDELEQALAQIDPVRTTEATLISVDEIRARVLEARQLGYAVTDEEIESGLRSVAAPVIDPSGRVVAALSVGTIVTRTSRTTLMEQILPALLSSANTLGRML